MAQIIKMQEGDKVPVVEQTETNMTKVPVVTPVYGRLIINGQSYDGTDDLIRQLHEYGAGLSGGVGYQFSKIPEAIKAGKTVTFLTDGDGQITGVDFDLSDRQKNRMSKLKLGFGRERNAREAIYAMKNFRPTITTTPVKKYRHDFSDALRLEYGVDDDGKRTIYDTVGNQNFYNRFDNYAKVLDYDDNDEFKGYKSMTKDQFVNWLNGYGKDKFLQLKDKIKTGNWDANDIATLNSLGLILEKTDDNTNPAAAKEKANVEKYKKYGFDYNKNKDQIAIDDKGNATIIDQNLLDYIKSTGQTDNLWLNDDFNAFTNNAYADLIDAANGGLFIYGGRVYRGNDPRLNQLVQYNDFIAQNKATGGNATSTKQWWRPGYGSGLSDMNFDADGNKVYSSVLNDSFGRDVTGEYASTPDGALIYEYIPNYSVDNAELFDKWGRPLDSKRKLVAIDPNTKQNLNWTDEQFNKLQKQNNPDRVNWYYSDKNTNRRTAFQRYYNYDNGKGYKDSGWIRVGGIGDPNNPGTGYVLFRDSNGRYYVRGDNPNNGNIKVISGPMSAHQMSDNLFLVDPRVAEYLIANNHTISKEAYDYLMRMIRNQFVEGYGLRSYAPGEVSNELKQTELYELLKSLYNHDYADYSYEDAVRKGLILP